MYCVRCLNLLLIATVPLAFFAWSVQAKEPQPGVLVDEFIYESAPFPSCHASTVVETSAGLAVAFFGGTDEGNDDVGIWLSLRQGKKWSAPVEVANGIESAEKRYPCWNPVLYQVPGGPLWLFYKVGPNPVKWWGMWISSDDAGKTWSAPRRLPEGIFGPIKNKPVLYKDQLLCPSSTEDVGFRVHIERTADRGATWQKTEPLQDWHKFGVIQPTILVHADGKLQILCRSQQKSIVESWSSDGGKTWTPLAATALPNPDSGIDAANLPDGRFLLVYNHTVRGRSPLNVAVSRDGKNWQAAAILETERGEYSYPAVIATADGKVHTTYTWKRKLLKHVELDPAQFTLRDIRDGQWPK